MDKYYLHWATLTQISINPDILQMDAPFPI